MSEHVLVKRETGEFNTPSGGWTRNIEEAEIFTDYDRQRLGYQGWVKGFVEWVQLPPTKAERLRSWGFVVTDTSVSWPGFTGPDAIDRAFDRWTHFSPPNRTAR